MLLADPSTFEISGLMWFSFGSGARLHARGERDDEPGQRRVFRAQRRSRQGAASRWCGGSATSSSPRSSWGSCVMIGFVLLFLPGVYIYCRLFATKQAILLEDRGGIAADRAKLDAGEGQRSAISSARWPCAAPESGDRSRRQLCRRSSMPSQIVQQVIATIVGCLRLSDRRHHRDDALLRYSHSARRIRHRVSRVGDRRVRSDRAIRDDVIAQWTPAQVHDTVAAIVAQPALSR